MAGFDSFTDQTQKFGSRGDWLLNNGASGVLSYNGYNFPPAINSRVTVVPEYDASERVVKWLTIAIEIRFIMTDPEIHPRDVGEAGPEGQITYNSMRSLIARLSQPGQALYFDAQGFGGQFRINDQGAASSIKDLDYGPKPQVTELQPLGGGNAFLANWLCTTRVSPLLDNYLGEFVEFTYSSEVNITNNGFMTRTINGTLELPGYAFVNIASEQTERKGQDIWTNGQLHRAQAFLLKTFPYLEHFERTLNFKFNESKRILTFTITDVERETDSWYPPGVGHFELKQNLSSDFETAFVEWTLTYSGVIEATSSSFTASMRQNKSLAWFWLWQIIKQRRRDFETYIRGLSPEQLEELGDLVNECYTADAEADAEEYPGGVKEPPWDVNNKLKAGNLSVLMYPLSVSFTDDMYGNSIDFTIAYRIYMTSSLVIKGLGLFEPCTDVDLQGLDKDSWVRYRTENSPLGLNGRYRTQSLATEEILVDICNPLTEPPPEDTGASNSNGEPVSSADVLDITVPENGKDWDHYSCKYAMVEEHRTVKGTKLMPTGAASFSEITNESLQLMRGGEVKPQELQFQPFSSTLEGPPELYNQIAIQQNTPTETTRYVIMQGYARRFSGPIAPPKLLAVGDAVAIQDSSLGLDVVEFETVKTGLSTGSKQCDLYITTWKKHYVLSKVPVGQQIHSTGIPRRFS